jgi:hypothetical protein
LPKYAFKKLKWYLVISGDLLGRDSLACTAAFGDVKHGYQPVLKSG